jgi:hypothetical protein
VEDPFVEADQIEKDLPQESEHNHPKVQMAANMVDLQVRGNTDYFGPLYIGDDYRENHMIYDTMSDWTIIIGDNAKGSNFPGNYNEKESTTAKPFMFKYGNDTLVQTQSVNLGSVDFNGEKYKEQMCLKQHRN